MNKFRKFMGAIAVTSALSLVFTSSVDAKQHVVKKGDTLYSIARNNGTTVAKIIQDNKIVNGLIKPGQVLNVGSVASVSPTTAKIQGSGQHKVQKGDTLYSIARKNGMTLDELKKLNNLTSNSVPIGRVLNVKKSSAVTQSPVTTTTKKVPTTKTVTKVPTTTKAQTAVKSTSTTIKGQHKVVKGDTLYSIARKSGMTVDELKKLNNLTSNNVAVGRVLVVNKTTAPKPVQITTTKNEETTKKVVSKPTPTTTTKKIANVPGATLKNQEDQELWNKVANNYKNDPSVKGLKPRVAQMKQFLGAKFDVKDFSLYRPGDNDGTGHGHGDGLALDLMVPVGGAKGDQISDYLVKNYDGLGIYYLIWKQKFYMNKSNIYGPAKTWNWMPDRGGVTANHYDHVHISFNK